MKDYVTGIDFNHYALNEYALAATGAWRSPQPSQYTTLRAQRRHAYDWPQGQYRPASTHAEAMEKFGFRVTSGWRR